MFRPLPQGNDDRSKQLALNIINADIRAAKVIAVCLVVGIAVFACFSMPIIIRCV